MPDTIAETFGDNIGSILGSIAGTIIAPGVGTAIGAGIGGGTQTGVETGDPLAGFTSGALQGAGSYLGGKYLGPEIAGNVTSPLATNLTTGANTALDMGLSPFEAGAFGNIAGNVAGDIAGGSIGSMTAENVGGKMLGMNFEPQAEVKEWAPTYSSGYSMPSNLSNLGGLSKQQQSTGLATQAMYGGGLGQDESKYFMNLINNRLLDQPGSNTADQLSPMELSYLDKLGLGGYSTENDLLKGIENYSYA